MQDKKALQSKKFKCFLFSTLLVSALLVIALFTQALGWPMALFMSIGMLIIGIMTITYTINQAAVDKLLTSISSIGGAIANVTKTEQRQADSSDTEDMGGI